MLKKILVLGVALIMSLGLFAGCGNVELKQGVYATEDGSASVTLHGDNEFFFVRDRFSSYCPTGKYSIKKGKLILHVTDDEEYIFDIKDGQLVSGPESGIFFESGTIFKLSNTAD